MPFLFGIKSCPDAYILIVIEFLEEYMEENMFLKHRVLSPLVCESTAEYILPDYCGDIRKILYTGARVLPLGSFEGNGSAEFSGNVEYTVVYEDQEHNLNSCKFTSEYELAVKCEEEEYAGSFCDANISTLSIRPVGPRKLSAKCTLSASVGINERKNKCVEGDTFDAHTPEVYEREVEHRTYDCIMGDTRSVRCENLFIDGAIEDDISVYSMSVTPRQLTHTVNEDGVEVKGELLVKILYKNGDSMATQHEHVVDFAEQMTVDNAADFYLPKVRVGMTKYACEVREDGVLITSDIEYNVLLNCYGNEKLKLVCDCYLCDYEVNNEYGEFYYTRLVDSVSNEITREYEVSKESVDGANIRNIIKADATAKINSTKIYENGVEIEGTVRLSAITCEINEDGTLGYGTVKFELPLKENVKFDLQLTENYRTECSVNVLNVDVDTDATNLYPIVSMCLDCFVLSDEKLPNLTSSYTFGEELAREEGVVTVYYPEKDETLFSVAKKFHKELVTLASDNSLSESAFSSPYTPTSLSDVDSLIIT